MTEKKHKQLKSLIRFHSANKTNNSNGGGGWWGGRGGGEKRKRKKKNSTELQKPNVEAEVNNNNKNCD